MVFALFENGVVTRVRSGENSGETLSHDFVVRALEKRSPNGKRKATASVTFSIDKGWSASKLGVAAFWQDIRTLHIYGGARAAL